MSLPWLIVNQIARFWQKNIFVNEHKWLNMVKNYKRFFNKMEELKLYLIGLDKNSKIIDKAYLFNCTIDSKNRWPVIVITHNKCTFFINNNICKV